MLIFSFLLLVAFFIMCEAFFSGSETAIISANRIKLERWTHTKDKSAAIIKKMLQEPERFLSTTLVGTNLSVVSASTLFTVVVLHNLGPNYEWMTTLILAPILLIFGEIIPKTVFRITADKVAPVVSVPLWFFMKIFGPVVVVLSFIVRTFLRPFTKGKELKKIPFVTREELRHLIQESEREGVVKSHERAMIYRIFDFGKKKVSEIMVPLKDVISIEVGESLISLVELSKKHGFTRIPVYEKKADNIIGFVNIYDVLRSQKVALIRDFLKQLLYVNKDDAADNVLLALRLNVLQAAVVKDEAGRNIGFVTVKDLLDEIIGEI